MNLINLPSGQGYKISNKLYSSIRLDRTAWMYLFSDKWSIAYFLPRSWRTWSQYGHKITLQIWWCQKTTQCYCNGKSHIFVCRHQKFVSFGYFTEIRLQFTISTNKGIFVTFDYMFVDEIWKNNGSHCLNFGVMWSLDWLMAYEKILNKIPEGLTK